MGYGRHSGLVWGLAASPESQELLRALCAPRSLTAPYAEQPEGESAVVQYYAPARRRVTLAREDIEPRWIGAWVAVSMVGLAVQHDCAIMDRIGALEALPTLYAEEIAEAKARWGIFRRWCVENLTLDPGEGSLLLAYDID